MAPYRPVRRALRFQRPVMLRRSVAGNLRYALRANAARQHGARIADLLALVGPRHWRIGRPGASGGEQQRPAPPRAGARSRRAAARRTDREPDPADQKHRT